MEALSAAESRAKSNVKKSNDVSLRLASSPCQIFFLSFRLFSLVFLNCLIIIITQPSHLRPFADERNSFKVFSLRNSKIIPLFYSISLFALWISSKICFHGYLQFFLGNNFQRGTRPGGNEGTVAENIPRYQSGRGIARSLVNSV